MAVDTIRDVAALPKPGARDNTAEQSAAGRDVITSSTGSKEMCPHTA